MAEPALTTESTVYVTYIRTTPEKLWKALPRPEFTRQYWVQTWQDCDWKPGILEDHDPRRSRRDSGEVLEIEPGRQSRPDAGATSSSPRCAERGSPPA